MAEDLKVKVTAYKGLIIISPVTIEKEDDFIPVTEPGHVGSVLSDTERRLGVSEEAWALLKTIPKSHDDIGEVDVWMAGVKGCFGWLGSLYRVIDPTKCDTSRTGIEDIPHVTIPNEPPSEAVQVIDSSEAETKEVPVTDENND